jgi:hypothetical protein
MAGLVGQGKGGRVIRTFAYVCCDGSGCGSAVLGCTDLASTELTRQANAVAAARDEGWRRMWVDGKLVDLCLPCYCCHVLLEPEPAPSGAAPLAA